MAGKISEDPDVAVTDATKFAAEVGGVNKGPLGSSIATYLASLVQTLTNKTINAASNTITNLSIAMFAAGVIDTDGTLAANSDSRIATQKAVKTAVDAAKSYADGLIAANDAMVFKGAQDCSANPNYPAGNRGDTWRVSVAGKIGGASGIVVEVGDMFICLTDGTASGNQATVGANWSVIQTNIDGAVVGPAASVSGNIASFNGTGGKTLQDSGFAISEGTWVPTYSADTGTFTGATITLNSAVYQKIGNWVRCSIDVTIAAIGSGAPASGFNVSLPFTPLSRGYALGFEQAMTGVEVRGTHANTAAINIKFNPSGTTVIANGNRIIISNIQFKV